MSAPTRVARTTSRPPALTVAPATSSPGCFSTGTDSPVSSDWSTAHVPSSTMPSVATFSPGRTTKRSPTASCSTGTRRSAAVGVEDRDVLGAELEQRLQRGAGAALGARLEVAARRAGTSVTTARDLEVDLRRRRRRLGDAGRSSSVMPVMPASPRNSAYSDHSQAASVPTRDQRVHRRRGVLEVRPGGAVERPGAPEDDRAWRAAATATASCRTAAPGSSRAAAPAATSSARDEQAAAQRRGLVGLGLPARRGGVGGQHAPGSRRPRRRRRAARARPRPGRSRRVAFSVA